MSTQRHTTAPAGASARSGGAYGADSGIGPVAEAARWIDREIGANPPPLLIVVGLAGGHVLAEIDRRAPAARVLALEPDPAHAEAFLTRQDLAAWHGSGRLKYLAGPDYRGAEDAWRLFSGPDAFKLLTHPRLTPGPGALDAVRVVKTIVFGVRANAEARRKFAPRYLRNVIRNVPAIAAGRDVQALAGRFRGVPGIITAAGPSLDDVLPGLHGLGTRGLIIATDTTLRPLLGAGVVPHLAVGADPGPANARHFLELPDCPSTWLVAESALDQRASAVFHGRTFWFRLANHHPWPWLRSLGVDAGPIEMWGSVLTAAFQVACLAGCDPIVIVGADLAFTGDRPYCRGTTYEFDWMYATARGSSLQDAWRAQMSRSAARTAPDIHGRDTTTTGALMSFRDWMVAHARRSGRRVINATGAGILHGDGILQMPLGKALKAHGPRARVDLAAPAEAAHDRSSEWARELYRIGRQLSAGDHAASPLAEWKAFSGEGFDGAALAEAVLRAAATLERAEQPAAPPAVIPWARLSPAGVSARTLARLAESAARATSSTTNLAAHGDDTALLHDALNVLDRICEAGATLDMLADTGGAERRAATSVAVLYDWPEQVRFAVQLFEGLLGAMGEAPKPEAATSFAGPPAVASGHEPAGNPVRACLRLVSTWIQRAASTDAATEVAVLCARLAALERLISPTRSRVHETVLTVSAASTSGETSSARVLLPVATTEAARALTGSDPGDSRPVAPARLHANGLAIDVTIAASGETECQRRTSRPA